MAGGWAAHIEQTAAEGKGSPWTSPAVMTVCVPAMWCSAASPSASVVVGTMTATMSAMVVVAAAAVVVIMVAVVGLRLLFLLCLNLRTNNPRW